MHAYVAAEHGVDVCVTGVDAQAPGVEGEELVHGGDHVDLLAPYLADDLGTDLLIATAEQTAVTAQDADDDAGLTPRHQADQLMFIKIRAHQRSVHDRVYAKQRRGQAEFGHDAPCRRAWPQQVQAAGFHLPDDLS
ncbi:hypothetical protein D3C84_683170 [compost metagenome]